MINGHALWRWASARAGGHGGRAVRDCLPTAAYPVPQSVTKREQSCLSLTIEPEQIAGSGAGTRPPLMCPATRTRNASSGFLSGTRELSGMGRVP
jgi:hypothetical protein